MRTKQTFVYGLTAVCLVLALVACSGPTNPGTNPGGFVAVTDITNGPTAATVGTPLTLSGTVTPSDATNKTIVWSVKSGAASISGSALNATAAGTVVVTATIANGLAQGTNYTKDFPIDVTAAGAFVAVTDITNGPTAATVGTPLTLSGTVTPSDAPIKPSCGA